MTQKAIKPPTATDRLRKSLDQSAELYNLNRIRKSPVTIGNGSLSNFGGSAAGSTSAAGNYLKTNGGVMSGVIAFNPAVASINSDGHIDITPVSTGIRTDTSYVLASGAGSPDDLNFIDGAQYNGQYLVLQGTASTIINLIHASIRSISNIVGTGISNIITVTTSAAHDLLTGAKINIIGTTNFDVQNKAITVTSPTIYTYDLGSTGSATPETSGTSQSGNIVISDGVDISMDGTIGTNTIPITTLIFDVTVIGNGAWRVIHGSEFSGGAAAFPSDYPVDDQGTKGTETVTHDLNATTAHKLMFTADGDVDITISNIPTSNAIDFYIQVTQNGTGGNAITVNDGEWINFPTLSTTADTVSLISCHADGDGNIRAIVLLNATPTAGDFASKQLDNLSSVAVNTSLISDTDDEDDLGSASIKWRDAFVNRNLRFGVVGQLHPTEPNIYADASGDMLFNVASADQFFFTENDVSIVGLAEGDTQLINNSGVSTLDLINRDSGIIDTDQIGELRFRADTDAVGESIQTYGRIHVISDDVTDGSVDGRMTIQVAENNTLTDYITMNSFSFPSVIQIHKELSMKTQKITDVVDPAAAQDAATKAYVDAGVAAVLTTKGDLVGFDSATTRIPISVTDGHILTVDSGEALGLKWAAAGAADNLGNHTATTDLDMENNSILDIDQIQVHGSSGSTLHGYINGLAGFFDINSNANDSEVRIYARDSGAVLTKVMGLKSGLIKCEQDFDVNVNDLLYAGTGNKLAITAGLVVASISSIEVFRYSASAIAFKQTLSMNSKKITSVLDPTSAQDVATKNYVDNFGAPDNLGDHIATQDLDMDGNEIGDASEINFGTESTQSDKFALSRGGEVLTLQIGSTGSGSGADQFRIRRGTSSKLILDETGWQFANDGIGFYGTSPVAQQTGVAVTAAGIHAALVNLGLITA